MIGKHAKPKNCEGCPLHRLGAGYVPGEGPLGRIVFLAEQAGYDEVVMGRPMVGAAGGMLSRILHRTFRTREQYRIENVYRCFPGTVEVSASGIQRGYRRWYVGELVTVTTEGGILTGTPNHPALTGRGWVPLGELVEGDDLLRGELRERARPSNPHVHDAPPRFEELFDALALASVCERVVGRDVDFHGDGSPAEVDIATVNSLLWDHAARTNLVEHAGKVGLKAALEAARLLESPHATLSTKLDLPRRVTTTARSVVGSLNHRLPLGRGEEGPAQSTGLGARTQSNTESHELLAQPSLPDMIGACQRLEGGPRVVAAAKVCKIHRTLFSGHVYNLQTESQEYIADGFIVHNCCPPGGEIRREWAEEAALHCSQYSRAALDAAPVVVAMGGTAIRQMLGLWDWDLKKIVENFHGTVTELSTGQKVVCTYHPSHLQRGAANLMGTVAFDLSVAEDVAAGTWVPEPITGIIDPHPEWFAGYVAQFESAVARDPWLALDTDIETPDKAKGKAEDELDESDASFEITRINFSYHDDEGITVPWVEPYIGLSMRLIAAARLHYLWNGEYDLRRLARQGVEFRGEIWDGMWLWHHYMSDVPKGLGFVAPFCSRHGAWKHLFTSAPGEYAAYDPAVGRRCTNRTVEALQARGQWEFAHRHTVRLMQEVLKPAQVIGIQVDRPELDRFEADLAQKTQALLARLQTLVPRDERPLTGGTKDQGFRKPPEGPHPDATTTKRDGTAKKGAEDWDPLKVELYQQHARVVELEVTRKVLVCRGCGAEEVVAKHRCADKRCTPLVTQEDRKVLRYFWLEPFNPDSPQQVLGYIRARGHKPGKNKKTRGDSADREALVRLRATTKDPFYDALLDYRGVAKVRGTYAIGVRKRLDVENRFHPVPTLKPSTLRTSYVAPNIQNVCTDKDSSRTIAAGFRRCIVASPGCKLVELDFSGIEAVQLAWYARDRTLLRLARLGLHAYLASHLLKRPADLSWSDEDLLAYFREIKTNEPYIYDQAKRNVHGNGYGMTPKGMWMMFPHLYASEAAAKRVQDIYFSIAPAVPKFQNAVRLRAYEQGYIGGPKDRRYASILDDPNAHPYGYRHDFFDVVALRPVGPEAKKRLERERIPLIELNGRLYAAVAGPDSKRTLAFYPQSTAAGNLKECAIALFAEPDGASYVGDAYYGRTPLRAPIHDSLLLEVPNRQVDRVLECAFREMLRPVEEQPLPAEWGLGPYLTIGVEAKGGDNWEDMEKVHTPRPADVGLDVLHYLPEDSLAFDKTYFPAEEPEEEDVSDLGIVVQ